MNWTPAFAGVTFQDTFYDIIIILPIIMDDFHAEKVLGRSGNPGKTLSIILNPAKFARAMPGVQRPGLKGEKNEVVRHFGAPYNDLGYKRRLREFAVQDTG